MMDLKYFSTRGDKTSLSASEAILKGISDDGGLFLPTQIPKLDKELKDFVNMSYQQTAYEILKLFYTDFTEDELKFCINNAYDEKFDTAEIAPIKKVGENIFLELFHGKTLAFKDMALSILPYLLTTSAKKNNLNKKIVILTATSGDTGKAALEGFKNVDGTSVVVFYPVDGVSEVQKAQMVTTDGNNTKVCGVKGNFDDTQTAVKNIFVDKDLRKKLNDKGIVFSSANSINIGRLFPQVVYYVYLYSKLVKNNEINIGEKINVTVPTGNFGNILSCYVAKMMGLPIDKMICASNENKVLYDFFKTGEYNKERPFVITASPSMDILISSNLERLIYLKSDAETTKKLFDSLNQSGKYKFDVEIDDIVGEFATDLETKESIKNVYEKDNYVMDTHTAVAYHAYKKFGKDSNSKIKNVIISTASPYKFPEDVCSAIDESLSSKNAFELFEDIKKFSGVEIPASIKDINKKPILHNDICEKSEIKSYVESLFL